METIIMNVESLPQHVDSKFQTKKVTVHERDGGLFLYPFQECSGLLGIAENDKLTLEAFYELKREDRELEI